MKVTFEVLIQNYTEVTFNYKVCLSLFFSQTRKNSTEMLFRGSLPTIGDILRYSNVILMPFKQNNISTRSKPSIFLSHFLRVLISSTGSNVLLLRNNLSCGVHLLFALLCGRPVVVLAEPRNERFVPFT